MSEPGLRARAAAFAALTRPRLLPSSMSDVIAGIALAGSLSSTGALDVVRALLFSLCVYAGGMVANDVADVREDTELGRDRPIPRGDVSRVEASVFAALLFTAAVLLAPRSLFALPWLLIGLVLLYDFVAKRNVVFGALTLGTCRALNLGVGIFVASAGTDFDYGSALLRDHGIVLAGYGTYTALAVVHGWLEDRSSTTPRGSSAVLITAACIPVALGVTDGLRPWMAVAALPTLYLVLRAPREGPAWLGKRTGILLRGLARFTFAIACGRQAWLEVAILAVPAWLLPWLFRPKRWS